MSAKMEIIRSEEELITKIEERNEDRVEFIRSAYKAMSESGKLSMSLGAPQHIVAMAINETMERFFTDVIKNVQVDIDTARYSLDISKKLGNMPQSTVDYIEKDIEKSIKLKEKFEKDLVDLRALIKKSKQA